MPSGDAWSEPDLLAAFALYCRIPFGRLHAKNPDIVRLAERMGRTPNALAMKLVNYAHLDPVQKNRGISGLSNVSKADVALWDKFVAEPDATAVAAESALVAIGAESEDDASLQVPLADSPTEASAVVRVRLVQGFFRRTVLASYDFKCAICAIPLPSLLCASHIIPWNVAQNRRADPTNGLSLCALHDRAFDRGLIALESDRRVLVSRLVKEVGQPPELLGVGLLAIEDTIARSPSRFHPSSDALAYHREKVFCS